MGLRGPKPTPPEIKALKGNPGKRRLALTATSGEAATLPRRLVAEPPRYLTEQAERDAFALALATLPANVVRASDINAVARWAVWLNIWVQCKSSLGSKKTKPDRKFDHKRMSDAEQHLIRLENHLGLTPSSRNAIVHRLFAMPGLHVIVEGIEGEPAQAAPPPADDESPLGWLLRKGKSHSH